jgi:nucleotide-binding universal stress UspA family protein
MGPPAGAPPCGPVFAFADRTGSPVEAVHAWSDLPLEALGAPDIETVGARQDAIKLLSEQVTDARRRHPGVPMCELVVLDRPMALLLARAVGAALLVIGRHGRARAGEMALGSVSHALLHYALCPVMVVG